MGRRTRIGRAAGFVYEDVDRALLERLVESMPSSVLPKDLGGALLFDHGVRIGYRLGERVVKYYRGGKLRDALRPSAAVRAALAYPKLLPIRSPKPACAFEVRRGLRLERSLILCEFVDGPLLGQAWGHVPEAERALGPFLADMHERRIYHGVMKWDHLVWNRGEWVVLDTESLRHPLRKLFPRGLAERQWASLALDLGPSEALERAFQSYLAARKLDWDPVRTWRSIEWRRGEILAGRARR